MGLPSRSGIIDAQPISAGEVRALRAALGLTQVQFAALTNVHPITMSRWESGRVEPGPWHTVVMRAFMRSVDRDPHIGDNLPMLLFGNGGVAFALYTVLRPGFEEPWP